MLVLVCYFSPRRKKEQVSTPFPFLSLKMHHKTSCDDIFCYTPVECFSPMGMSNGTILDHEISGSSTIDKAHPAFYARVITAQNERVSTRGSWCAKLADKEQFLEIDLKKPRKVTG